MTHPEIYELQKKIGRPFTWTALLTIKGSPFAETMAELNARERAAGADVWPQITCRPLTFQMNLADPFTFNTVPSFAKLIDRPVEERLAAYRDPDWLRTAAALLVVSLSRLQIAPVLNANLASLQNKTPNLRGNVASFQGKR